MRAWNRKTPEEFCKELKNKEISFEPLEEYIDAKTKIKFRCQKCGHIWKAQPTNILIGRGCPNCKIVNARDRYMSSQNEFERKVAEKNPDVEILSEYTGNKNNIHVRCKKHWIDWWTKPSVVLRGCGCSACMNEKISEKNGRTHDEFLEVVKKNSPHIEVLGRYKNAKTKIKVRCKLHDEIYYVTPDLIAQGSGNCPKCNYTSGEFKVANYLDYKGYEYIPQYSFQSEEEIKNKRFDFYIPSAKTCIEYDGIQHFEPVKIFGGKEHFEYTKKNDAIKNDFCKRNHINLIRVPYTISDVGRYLESFGV